MSELENVNNTSGETDVTKAMTDDYDLLDALKKTSGESNPTGSSDQIPKKVEITGTETISSLYDLLGNSGNPGTGDLLQDLVNWISGLDKLPSDPLSTYLSNCITKSELGMFFLSLQNITRIKRLNAFIDEAESIIYNPDNVIGLDPDELKDRAKDASTIVQNLFEMNRRTVSMIKQNKKDEEIDKLKMLIGAIPTAKLKDLINSLNK